MTLRRRDEFQAAVFVSVVGIPLLSVHFATVASSRCDGGLRGGPNKMLRQINDLLSG